MYDYEARGYCAVAAALINYADERCDYRTYQGLLDLVWEDFRISRSVLAWMSDTFF